MKKSIIFLILICLFLTACGNEAPSTLPPAASQETRAETAASSTSNQSAYGLKLPLSIEEAVEMFPYIADVLITSDPVPAVNDGFSVSADILEWFQGEGEDQITLRLYDTSLKRGTHYILFMEKVESVIEQTSYYSCGETVYSLEDRLYTDSIVSPETLTEEDFLGKLRTVVQSCSYTGDEWIKGSYIHSDNIDTILNESAYIAEVVILSLQQTAEDRELAVCRPLRSFKGELPASFQTVVPLHSTEVNGQYLLMLKKVDGIFEISSPHSIISAVSDEADYIRKQFP